MEQTTYQPYSDIYEKLRKIIPNLEEHIAEGRQNGKSELHTPGMMDLCFDYLCEDGKGNLIIALAHNFEMNGDLVPDPDMEIRVMPDIKMAEAMSFQNQYIYQEVYETREGKEFVRLKLKEDLNAFLDQWLSNCIAQGHCIDLSERKRERTVRDTDNEKDREQGIGR